MEYFMEAKEIIATLNENGYEAHIVGGAVRNLLMKKAVRDIDIATSATYEEIKSIFPKVIPVGIEHGTVIVRYKGISYELTTYRNSSDQVEDPRSLMTDLQYRDFTINAMALNSDGTLIDLFNGEKHLNKQIIQSVDNPIDRFKEDPLRIIRALRFVSQLNFTIEQHTLTAMQQLVHLLENVAVERIKNEFSLLFQADFVQKALDYFLLIEGYEYIPIFKNKSFSKELLHYKVTAFHSFAEVIAFYHYLNKKISINEWIRDWKCSNKERNEAINLIESIKKYKAVKITPWLLYRLDEQNIRAFIHSVALLFNDTLFYEELLKKKISLPINERRELAINGKDLIELFPSQNTGPWIHTMLHQIEYQVITGGIPNKKEQIKEWITCHPPEVD